MELIGKLGKSGVDVEGSADALRALSKVIRSAAGSAKLSLFIPATNPEPYLGYAQSLRIAVGEGDVDISLVGDEIVISGSAAKLAILSSNIWQLAEQRETLGRNHDHIHIEYHPGHYYLRETSTPLVVTRQTRVVR